MVKRLLWVKLGRKLPAMDVCLQPKSGHTAYFRNVPGVDIHNRQRVTAPELANPAGDNLSFVLRASVGALGRSRVGSVPAVERRTNAVGQLSPAIWLSQYVHV